MIWLELLAAPEVWMALSLLAALLPGPQTRVLPAVFRAVARVLGGHKRSGTENGEEAKHGCQG